MDIFISPAFHHFYEESPLKLVDVGASGGLKENWQRAKKYLQVIAFEPDERAFNELKKNSDKNVVYINSALHNDKREIDLYLTKTQVCSSILEPDVEFTSKFSEDYNYTVVKKIRIGTDTLDNQLSLHKLVDVDFIKLDTQGSELFILQGAKETLKDVFGLEIEISFNATYKNSPYFADVDRFVRELGFRLFDLKPFYWKRAGCAKVGQPKGQLIQGDALYLKDVESIKAAYQNEPFGSPSPSQKDLAEIRPPVLANESHFDRRLKNMRSNKELFKGKLLRALSVCILYGYLDYCLALVDEFKSVFTDDELTKLQTLIRKQAPLSAMIPPFHGRKWLSNLIYKMYKFLKPYYYTTTTTPTDLGNFE